MKNKRILLGVLAFTLTLGMLSCKQEETPEEETVPTMPATSGKLTIAGLEDYNGMYINSFERPTATEPDGWIAAKAAKDTSSGGSYSADIWNVQISGGEAVLPVWKVTRTDTGYTFENFTENWPPSGTTVLYFAVTIYSSTHPYGSTEVARGKLNPTPKFVDGVCTTVFIKED